MCIRDRSWDAWAVNTVRAPLVIGHEFYGEIVEVGSAVTGPAVGDRASGEGHIVCGHCRNCRAGRRHVCINTIGIGVNRDGAFADYVVLPATNAWVQPDSIDPDLGAIFDPLGNATHTALQWSMVGEDVLITGAGPIGVIAAAIARHAGAKNVCVTDLSDYRLDLARRAGADLVVNVGPTRIKDAQRALEMREGFDNGLGQAGGPARPGNRRLVYRAIANDPLCAAVLSLAEIQQMVDDLFAVNEPYFCLLYTSPSPRDRTRSRMPSSA